MQVDRFSHKYPSLSPYIYVANNPLRFIDVNGDSLDLSQLNEIQQRRLQELQKQNDYIARIIEHLRNSSNWYSVVVDPKRLSELESGRYDYNEDLNGNVASGGVIVLSELTERNVLHEGYHAYQHDAMGNEFFQRLGNTTYLEAEAFTLNYLSGQSVPRAIVGSARAFSRTLHIGPSPVSMEKTWRNLNASIPQINIRGQYPYQQLSIYQGPTPYYLIQFLQR
jgi:hypothetical protein